MSIPLYEDIQPAAIAQRLRELADAIEQTQVRVLSIMSDSNADYTEVAIRYVVRPPK